MPLILNIETSTSVCSVALSKAGEVLALKETAEHNSHAAQLTLFIEEVLKESSFKLSDLSAIAVSSGPGSYTGLRIGYSTVKGLCYALDKPMIVVDTLMALAEASKDVKDSNKNRLYCPMIDARRMEVYCSLYDAEMKQILPIQAKILDALSFKEYFDKEQEIVFSGNGAFKIPELIQSKAAIIRTSECSAKNMAFLSYNAYKNSIFENVAYSTPLYVKAPYITKPRKRL